MFKMVLLGRKRPDLSREQFMDYYSNHHVPFVSKLLQGQGAAIHRRNFVVPAAPVKVDVGPNMNTDASNDYDVISEVFYEDHAAAARAMRFFSDPELVRQIEEDEARFLERGSLKKYMVEVQETVIRPISGHGI